MLPLKLLRSPVSLDDLTDNPLFLHTNHLDDNHPISRNRIPLMLFLPTQELVKDSYRLASLARAIGMDLHPNPSLSHIIFSWPSPPSSCSSSSSSSSCSFPNDAVPLPFPSFATASLSHLRLFASLSKGYFKLAFLKNGCLPFEKNESLSNNNWHCTSLSLFCAGTSERIGSMDGFSRALLGKGWTLFKTVEQDSQESIEGAVMFMYRKLDVSRIGTAKELSSGDLREMSRVRELRLPQLDFRNVPLRILQYILLMTDDVFYLS